ncbi:complement resistance protein TraT [Escherichia coli]|uniref:complement resistance protein TraT n=1 Tax=Escherichia coli TaxID=562 RepID=UPI002E174F9D|nr:complement resistance protein TraT [Escherichia coli]MEC6370125.1 complement resistance protein TraT [Escherichia coli]
MVNGGQASIAISNTSPNLFTVPGDRIIAVNSLDGALTNNEQTASGGVVVAALRQGTSGAKIQTSTETGNQHKYQTRVVSNANKVNLKFEEAKPVLEDQLAKSIANIL